MRIRDPGWKNCDPGSGINIPDPLHSKNEKLRYRVPVLKVAYVPLRKFSEECTGSRYRYGTVAN
jgi:hypothetical protein